MIAGLTTLRIGAVLLSLFAAAALACSEGDASSDTASSDTTGGGAGSAVARAAADGDAAAPVDSAVLLARAATARWQEACQSDSVAFRHGIAVAAADSAVADSIRVTDSTHTALIDSLSRDTTRAARTKLAALKGRKPAVRKTPAWAGKVARRAMSQTPLPGSLFPGCRVVAYYGNPLSRRMGILGEIAPDSMLARLARQAEAYQRADPATHVVPALELIAIVAQADAGRDGLYRARMPDSLIERVAAWADEKGYILILDIQNGHSDMAREVSSLVKFLKRPNVHLALDPEFAMPDRKRPGTVIGTLDAREVNQAVDTLARLVEENDLPPKMLIVHRFTRPMLTNQEQIKLDPRVQVVIDMDGFGAPFLKRDSYRRYVFEHPVQFTGFKIFYKNDKPMLTPEEVMKLVPVPVFVMYQ